MTFTVALNARACGHIRFTATASNGRSLVWVTTRDELTADPTREDIQEAVEAVVRNFAKQRRAAGDTWAQVKTAVEAQTFRL